jgi:hypothetical protein
VLPWPIQYYRRGTWRDAVLFLHQTQPFLPFAIYWY